MSDNVVLKVGEPDPTHVGRNIVTLDRKTKEQLGLTSGDIIELEGSKKTAAIIWPASAADEAKGIIRMDSFIRHNAGAGLGEKVTVRKANYSEAKKLILAPTQQVRIIASGYERILKKSFMGRPMSRGDNVWISVFGSGFVYRVVETNPKGIVKITENTTFQLKEQPVKGELDNIPTISYDDIGGLDEQIKKVRELIELPMRYPELFKKLGINPPKGVLLYGPPGTGKTLLAKAVASETNAHFISVNAPEIMSKFVGEAEERIRELFKEAEENAPSIIFIDELDAIAPKRDEVMGEVERRVVAQILALMDGLNSRGDVIVIAATNRINSIDEALRRPGRFDREVEFGVPNQKSRSEILLIHTRGMPLAKDVDLSHFANITHGFVGADLEALAKESAMKALRRYLPEINFDDETIPTEVLESMEVTEEDFQNGLKEVQPSALREVAIEIPNVKWGDIGGLDSVKAELKQVVEWPLKNPEVFTTMGIKPPSGILLYGPPGTGKTMLAKAVANESNANFISIKGPELLSMYVGESLPFDEELLVFDGKKIFKEKIGNIVEKKLNLQVVTFDLDGKVLFSNIKDYIRHSLKGKMLEVTTKTGRKIRVTDKHSLFSLKDGEIESVATNELQEGKSIIAIPSKIPNISVNKTPLNLFDYFKNMEHFVVSNISDSLKETVKKFKRKKVSEVMGISKKYLSDIICKNQPITTLQLSNLIKELDFNPDFSSMTIGVKGARNHMPLIFNPDEDFFRLLGLFAAEGDYNRNVVRIHAYNDEIRKDIIQILNKMDLRHTLTETSIVVNSYIFKYVLEEIFELKSGAFVKRVPPVLFTSPNKYVQNFLRGYYSGDGSIHGNSARYDYKHIIEAPTVSKELANDLLYLLLKQGIVAHCKEKLEWTKNISYRIQIFGVDNFRRFSQIGFIDKKRNNLVLNYLENTNWERSNKIPMNYKIKNLLDDAFGSYPNNNSVGLKKLKQALTLIDLSKVKYANLWKLVDADIYWDRVESINEIPYDGLVYDISVEPCQNFLAGFGGVFAHNSERGVRKVFRKARQVAPVIIFFDEIDSLAPRRGTSSDSHVTERVVNQLLTEIDGVESMKNVVFMAATNRPDLVDPSLLRPGRIDKLIKIGAPDEKARLEILNVHTKNVPLDKEVSLDSLVKKTEGFSGADLEGLIREAVLIAITEGNLTDLSEKSKEKLKHATVNKKHFDKALEKITASISEDLASAYEGFQQKYAEFKPSYIG